GGAAVVVVAAVDAVGAKKQKLKTPVHKGGDTNPKWNHSLKFMLDDDALNQDCLKVDIKLVSNRILRNTKIGKIIIPAKELLQDSGEGVSYQLVTRKGRSKGSVIFRSELGEKYWVEPEPVVQQPQKPVGGGGGGGGDVVLGLLGGLLLGGLAIGAMVSDEGNDEPSDVFDF
ncbi:hypothetical protein ABKV19_020713, partial [Rosa sericea]